MMLMLPYSSRSGVADHGLAGRNGHDRLFLFLRAVEKLLARVLVR